MGNARPVFLRAVEVSEDRPWEDSLDAAGRLLGPGHGSGAGTRL